MNIITRKSEVKVCLEQCIRNYHAGGLKQCIKSVDEQLLTKKVKFPLLEYCAESFYQELNDEDQILFCDQIQVLKREGGNVLIGKLLQLRAPTHYSESIDKACEYIAAADIWYVCDIIGERVFGHALLYWPEKTIDRIKTLSQHKNNWVLRSLGAGVHFAVKKGLSAHYVEEIFPILLAMANTTDKEIRQGVGWAAKTTAKFHPDIITSFSHKIDDTEKVANWFRRKVSIGLNRNFYAKRN